MIRTFLDKQHIPINKLQNVPRLFVLCLLPYAGVHSVCLKKELNKFLGKIYPILIFGLFFNQPSVLKISFPSRILTRVTFALLLLRSLRVVALRRLVMVKQHATSSLYEESI